MAGLSALGLGIAITVVACGSPPSTEIEAAKASLDRAVSERADQYAAESLKAAQAARAALDTELKEQESLWVKSYDRARELAVAAKAAGDKALADVAVGKEAAEAVAAKAKAATAAAAARAKAIASAVRVGGPIKPPTKIKDVQPVYPAVALAAKATGAVVIEATIGTDGKVVEAKVVKSVPLLDQAALDAVQQWEYMPSLQNGVPVPIVMQITVNFTRP